MRAGDRPDALAQRVLPSVAAPVDEPGRSLRAGFRDGTEHADHGSESNAGAQQDHRRFSLRVQDESPSWSLGQQSGADLHPVVKVVGCHARVRVRLVGRRGLALDGEAVVVLLGRIGERMRSEDRLILAGDVQPQRQELTGQEWVERLRVVRDEVEGADVVALANLSRDHERSEHLVRFATGVRLFEPPRSQVLRIPKVRGRFSWWEAVYLV